MREGITVLVGCNGLGKTTLIKNIRDELKKQNIEAFSLKANDRLNDDFMSGFNKAMSSEGEGITIDVSRVINNLREYIDTGIVPSKFPYLESDKKESKSSERWLLFDSIDSGYSIDNIIDFKTFLEEIMKDAKDKNLKLYIIIAANSYEFANGQDCMDVSTGKYLRFKSYETYKKFILKTRDKKTKRIEKAKPKKLTQRASRKLNRK